MPLISKVKTKRQRPQNHERSAALYLTLRIKQVFPMISETIQLFEKPYQIYNLYIQGLQLSLGY